MEFYMSVHIIAYNFFSSYIVANACDTCIVSGLIFVLSLGLICTHKLTVSKQTHCIFAYSFEFFCKKMPRT